MGLGPSSGAVILVIETCWLYCFRLVVGQFPPSLLELLILIGGGGVELDKKSILEG